MDRARRDRAAGTQHRRRRRDRCRGRRDQGRPALCDRRRQSGAPHPSTVSPRPRPTHAGPRVVGLAARQAAPGAARFPRAVGTGVPRTLRMPRAARGRARRRSRDRMSRAMDLRIAGGRILRDGALEECPVHVSRDDGLICDIGADRAADRTLDAGGLLLLPGIVDIHGDAFERQIMPRPGVDISLDIGRIETDRQAIANGITTVFHGVTWSWEPGLRSADNARAILAAMEELRPWLGADTKFHLRHETFNLDAEPEIIDWISSCRIGVLAFNNHMPAMKNQAPIRPAKIAEMAQRSGISHDAFRELVSRIAMRVDEVPDSIARLSAAANANGVPLLSHDDISPEQRRWYRSMGCRLAEFPTTIET